MTNELKKIGYRELEFQYRQEICGHPDAATAKYLELRTELLRRLASAVPAGPRCPKCGKGDNDSEVFGNDDGSVVAECKDCHNRIRLDFWADCAQFFAPSPATGQPPHAVYDFLRELSKRLLGSSRDDLSIPQLCDALLDSVPTAAVPAPESVAPPRPFQEFPCAFHCTADNVSPECSFHASPQSWRDQYLSGVALEEVAREILDEVFPEVIGLYERRKADILAILRRAGEPKGAK